MTKKYAILHILTGNYIWVGLSEPIKERTLHTALKNWINTDSLLHSSIYGFFLSSEFVPALKRDACTAKCLYLFSRKLANDLIDNSEFKDNISIDLYDIGLTDNPNTPIDSSQFAVVEV